ncbi:hypothetical protein ALC53_12673 [Atta colombica]|uniref:Uncharacterized protein n=1 Tax=Atta colombica TaxID=520822 RepID=A0A151HZ10_9HYME|nr:hypothetical protein ALC53_12673 [Atta colombica]
MIIQEGRISNMQRYRSRGELCAKGTEISSELEEEVERKDFFSQRTAIFVSQTLVALPIRRKLRSPYLRRHVSSAQ